MSNIYKVEAFKQCTERPEVAFSLWIEQIGDAELYEQAYHEGTPP
jgi:hypothetical protein